MLYYAPKTTDPYHNLATEQHLFDTQKTQDIFMLWQNDNAIIIGKNQNADAEINRNFVDQRGICVARRLSGGGAVYHDMGNLNFTFIMSDKKDIDFQYFCQPVMQALAQFGIIAEAGGRNDITIDGKKFSGNAQYRKDGRVMHHGTIMFDCDLDAMQTALTPGDVKLEGKGVKSVRSRVTNIKEHLADEITLADFAAALVKNVLGSSGLQIYQPSNHDMAAITRLQDEIYATWQWNFGASPQYTVQKKQRVQGCGTLDFYLDIKHGKIQAIQCFGDFFSDKPFLHLAQHLVGCSLQKLSIAAAIENININEYFYNLSKETFIKILCE